MAYRRRRQTIWRGRAGGPKKDMRWVTETFKVRLDAQLAVAGVGTAIVVVSDYDFSAGGVEPKGATVMACHLLVSVAHPFSTTVPDDLATLMMGVRHANEDELLLVLNGNGDPRITTELIDQDWLWLHQMHARGVSFGSSIDLHALIKSRRILRESQLVFAASSDQTGAATGVWGINVVSRTLLKYG